MNNVQSYFYKHKNFIKFVILLVLYVSVTLAITTHIVGLAIVSGESMRPTMYSGTVLIVNKI